MSREEDLVDLALEHPANAAILARLPELGVSQVKAESYRRRWPWLRIVRPESR